MVNRCLKKSAKGKASFLNKQCLNNWLSECNKNRLQEMGRHTEMQNPHYASSDLNKKKNQV